MSINLSNFDISPQLGCVCNSMHHEFTRNSRYFGYFDIAQNWGCVSICYATHSQKCAEHAVSLGYMQAQPRIT